MHRPHKAEKYINKAISASGITENKPKVKEEIRHSMNFSKITLYATEQTSPLDVPTYAFGRAKSQVFLPQFVQSALF